MTSRVNFIINYSFWFIISYFLKTHPAKVEPVVNNQVLTPSTLQFTKYTAVVTTFCISSTLWIAFLEIGITLKSGKTDLISQTYFRVKNMQVWYFVFNSSFRKENNEVCVLCNPEPPDNPKRALNIQYSAYIRVCSFQRNII